ncbi:MAG TPA: tRNA (N6-threonylcarbamoyladenosine(37)-N6)-methyltransferase TrmO [Polyangiales bacterium]|nr:tRNA (N6-threonylcarbamoyladenosine(37)-N6)-methyltransferase TrmO [Polyangiales bacterium]
MRRLPTLELTPIGLVHSPWRDKHSAPRQPSEARGVHGRIELLDDGPYEHALSDLSEWSHVWVLFWFHLNPDWHAKVLPPRSSKKRGVFATRSPHRPNPIGMSVVRLLKVKGRVLEVSDIDMLDQTPVLDIKPYVAYTDAVSDANAGWLELEQSGQTDPGPRYDVEFAELAEAQLEWLTPRIELDLRSLAEEVLRVGPTPHPYRRIRVREGRSILAIKDFRLHFSLSGQRVRVEEIFSGYRPRVLADPNAKPRDRTPLEVHRDFVRQFGDIGST